MRPLGQDGIDRQVDAIRGGSIDGVEVSSDPFNPEGTVQGEGMGDGALLSIGRYNKDLPDLSEGLCQNDDPLGMDSVVIGHQNLRTLTHIMR